MTVDNFFENLETLFEDADQMSFDIQATIVRRNGKVEEIQIFNQKFDDILVISRNGLADAINICEYQESK